VGGASSTEGVREVRIRYCAGGEHRARAGRRARRHPECVVGAGGGGGVKAGDGVWERESGMMGATTRLGLLRRVHRVVEWAGPPS
jgi:hypothetical protein